MRTLFPKLIGILAALLLVQNVVAASPELTGKSEVLTLQQCLDLAFTNNKSIQEAEKNIMIAQAGVRQAQGSFRPTLGYDLTDNNSSATTNLNSSKKEYAKDYLAGNLKAALPIDTNGKLEAGLKLAQLKLTSAQEELRKAKQLLTYTVKQDYYQVWQAEKQLEVQQASYDNINSHYQQVQKFFNAGAKSGYEVFQAQVQRDTLKPKVISAQNTLALNQLQLATVIGYPKDRRFTVDDDATDLQLPEQPAVTLDAVLAQAWQNRPEIHENQQTAAMNRVQAKLDAAANKPTVSLNANVKETYAGNSGDDYWNCTTTLAIGVTGNFYDGGVANAKVAQDQASQELTALKEADLRDTIQLDAEQALQNLSSSLETIRANQAGIDLARETLRMTQARYKAGLATTMDVMDSELALDNNLNQYYQGIGSYLTALAKLDVVAGKD
jgi:outer membrane protein TolC